jgi:hypothetical protein
MEPNALRRTLDEMLAEALISAPAVREWLRASEPGHTNLILALDTVARHLRAAGPRDRTSPAELGASSAELGASPAELGASSAELGIRGEDEVHRVLAAARPTRSVARRPHSGDLVCSTAAGPILIEVKNREAPIPAAETRRFLRDLRENDAAAGVFLSLASPIAEQRETVAVVLEPRVAAGCLVPVVFAAAPRGSDRPLAPDIMVAAVDMAAHLAAAYPRGMAASLSRDSAHTYAHAAEQLAEGLCSVRRDLARLADTTTTCMAELGERLAGLTREARHAARGCRAAIEEAFEAPPEFAADFLASLRARYDIQTSDANLMQVYAALTQASDAKTWALAKTRVTHTASGCAFEFPKGVSRVRVPLAAIQSDVLAATIQAHPKKAGLAGGFFTLELDDTTIEDVLRLLASRSV